MRNCLHVILFIYFLSHWYFEISTEPIQCDIWDLLWANSMWYLRFPQPIQCDIWDLLWANSMWYLRSPHWIWIGLRGDLRYHIELAQGKSQISHWIGSGEISDITLISPEPIQCDIWDLPWAQFKFNVISDISPEPIQCDIWDVRYVPLCITLNWLRGNLRYHIELGWGEISDITLNLN
jgi:hypothetical protein